MVTDVTYSKKRSLPTLSYVQSKDRCHEYEYELQFLWSILLPRISHLIAHTSHDSMDRSGLAMPQVRCWWCDGRSKAFENLRNFENRAFQSMHVHKGSKHSWTKKVRDTSNTFLGLLVMRSLGYLFFMWLEGRELATVVLTLKNQQVNSIFSSWRGHVEAKILQLQYHQSDHAKQMAKDQHLRDFS